MPFHASLELLITPERFVNVDLTRKGIYKIQLIFPQCVTKGKLLPSLISLEKYGEDLEDFNSKQYCNAEENCNTEDNSNKNSNDNRCTVYINKNKQEATLHVTCAENSIKTSNQQNFIMEINESTSNIVSRRKRKNFKFLPCIEKNYNYGPTIISLRKERYPTSLSYHSFSIIETLQGTSILNPTNARLSSSAISQMASLEEESRDPTSTEQASSINGNNRMIRLVNNRRHHRESVYLPENVLTLGKAMSPNHDYKIIRYTSNHFNVLYKDQENTFQDNILLNIELSDILEWIQSDLSLDICVQLLIFNAEVNSNNLQESFETFNGDVSNESNWTTILSNTVKIHRIWEGTNCVWPVSFFDGRNFAVLWSGFHACITNVEYTPHDHTSLQSSLSQSQSSSGSQFVRSASVNEDVTIQAKSLFKEAPIHVSPQTGKSVVSKPLKRNSIRNHLLSVYALQHQENTNSIFHSLPSFANEYVMQRYERDFFSHFVPYIIQNMQAIWKPSQLSFYSQISHIMTICSHFIRFMARNWLIMNESLNISLEIQLFDISPSTPSSKEQSPTMGDDKFFSPMAKRRNSQPPSPKVSQFSTEVFENSLLYISRSHKCLGEKWVQLLNEMFKKRAERPWMLPIVINELFRTPFAVEMQLRWGKFTELCSKSLGNVHLDLRKEFIEDLTLHWSNHIKQPVDTFELHRNRSLKITDSLLYLPNRSEDRGERFTVQYLDSPNLRTPSKSFQLQTPTKGLNSEISSPKVLSPQFSKYVVDNTASTFQHFIVFVPGFKGSHHDFRLMRFLLEIQLHPSCCRYYFFEPDSDLYHTLSIQEMAIYLAQKISEFIMERNLHFEKVSFIAHSLGGIIVRAMLQPGTQSFNIFKQIFPRSSLHLYCSMGTPHLGSFRLKSKLVSTAIYLMSSVQKIKCLQALSFTDNSDPTKSWLFNLNSNLKHSHLKYFEHVILCGSTQDTFVNFNSSVVHMEEDNMEYNYTITKDVLRKWIRDFNNCLSEATVTRMNIHFSKSKRNATYQETFEKFTGKYFHVSFMLDPEFLNLFISLHLRKLFESN